MANGEIAQHDQFPHLPQCFQKSSAADASDCIYKWVKGKLIQTLEGETSENVLFHMANFTKYYQSRV